VVDPDPVDAFGWPAAGSPAGSATFDYLLTELKMTS